MSSLSHGVPSVCTCTGAHVQVRMPTSTYAHGGQGLASDTIPWVLFFMDCPHLSQELIKEARLAVQRAPGIHQLCFPSPGTTHTPLHPAFSHEDRGLNS